MVPTATTSTTSTSRAASPCHPLDRNSSPAPRLAPAAATATATATATSPTLHHLPPPSRSPSPSSSPAPGSTRGVRSRKPASATTTPPFDAHVTRPSLQRLTSSTHTITPATATATDSHSNRAEGTTRRSLDQLSRTAITSRAAPEREIILHELAKTDTIASISLQYGITPQALRASNRLWPSDSIHLRKTLNIPLDQCHLPSASAGFERIVRGDDGNLVVWQRGASTEDPSTPNEEEAIILSPKARRLASASAFELGMDSSSRNGSTGDLLGLWGNGTGGRNSFDLPDEPTRRSSEYHDFKGKGRSVLDSPTPAPPPLGDDLVANYLPTTNNPYSSPGPSSPAPLLSLSPAPPQPPPPPHPTDPPDPSPLQKRTLTISRVPSSSLSFFPPSASASTSNPSSARSSLSEDDYHPTNPKGSFFGPLANSLARLNLPIGRGGGGGGGEGRRHKGGLGSWSTQGSSRNSSTSSLEISSHLPSWTKRWDLSYFGGEEEEAVAAGGVGGMGMGMGMQGVESWKLPKLGNGSGMGKMTSKGGSSPRLGSFGSAAQGKQA